MTAIKFCKYLSLAITPIKRFFYLKVGRKINPLSIIFLKIKALSNRYEVHIKHLCFSFT